jgi:hypothetical protein
MKAQLYTIIFMIGIRMKVKHNKKKNDLENR